MNSQVKRQEILLN